MERVRILMNYQAASCSDAGKTLNTPHHSTHTSLAPRSLALLAGCSTYALPRRRRRRGRQLPAPPPPPLLSSVGAYDSARWVARCVCVRVGTHHLSVFRAPPPLAHSLTLRHCFVGARLFFGCWAVKLVDGYIGRSAADSCCCCFWWVAGWVRPPARYLYFGYLPVRWVFLWCNFLLFFLLFCHLIVWVGRWIWRWFSC